MVSQDAPLPDPLPVTSDDEGSSRGRRQSRFSFFLTQGVVVVASVLFALAVDRMVSRMDENALERSYLEGLSEDFRNIEGSTAYALASAAMRDTAAMTVLAATRGSVDAALTGIDLARALELTGWVLDLQVANDTWEDMANTGSLDILQNGDLRREVASFYRQTDQLRGYEWTEQVRPYGEAVRTLLEPELRAAIGMEFIYREPIPSDLAPDVALLARRIRSSDELRPAFGDVLLINRVSARLYTDLNERARRITQMIDDEIEASR